MKHRQERESAFLHRNPFMMQSTDSVSRKTSTGSFSCLFICCVSCVSSISSIHRTVKELSSSLLHASRDVKPKTNLFQPLATTCDNHIDSQNTPHVRPTVNIPSTKQESSKSLFIKPILKRQRRDGELRETACLSRRHSVDFETSFSHQHKF